MPGQGGMQAGPEPVEVRPTFKTEVEYVEVDVVVTDGQGAVVRHLQKAGFQGFEDGKAQAISNFSLVNLPIERADRPLFAASPIEPDVRSNERPFDGRVYVMTGTGVVACLDAASGTTQWQVDGVEAFQGRPSTWGFAESLLLCDDRVICTPGGKQTSCVALDRQTGARVWKTKSLDQWAAMCSPILVQRGGTRLIVTLGVREVLGIDARNGQTLWSFPFEDPDHVDDAVNPQSPIYHDGHLFVLSAARNLGGMLLRLTTDGKSVERWNCQSGGGRMLGEGSWRAPCLV